MVSSSLWICIEDGKIKIGYDKNLSQDAIQIIYIYFYHISTIANHVD